MNWPEFLISFAVTAVSMAVAFWLGFRRGKAAMESEAEPDRFADVDLGYSNGDYVKHKLARAGGVDPDFRVAGIDGIDNDGGAW